MSSHVLAVVLHLTFLLAVTHSRLLTRVAARPDELARALAERDAWHDKYLQLRIVYMGRDDERIPWLTVWTAIGAAASLIAAVAAVVALWMARHAPLILLMLAIASALTGMVYYRRVPWVFLLPLVAFVLRLFVGMRSHKRWSIFAGESRATDATTSSVQPCRLAALAA